MYLTFAAVNKQYIRRLMLALFQALKAPENRLMNGRIIIAASYAGDIKPAIS